MYRRLKNILGVSLIILAIVLSQLPMGDVQADPTDTGVTEEVSNDQDDGNTDIRDEVNDDSADDTGNDVEIDDENDDDIDNSLDSEAGGQNTDSLVNQPALIDDGDSTDTATSTSTTKYTVTFDYGFLNINAEPETIEVAHGEIITADWKIDGASLVEGTDYTIDNLTYTFKGWCKDSTCMDGWDIKTETVTNKRTLYASWVCTAGDRIFNVSYSASDADSADAKLQAVKVQAGQRLTAPSLTPTKKGSTFTTWVEKMQDGTYKEIKWNEIPTEDKYYYARWEDKEYTITFHANGGKFENGLETKTAVVTRDFTIEETMYPTSFTYDGYTTDENWYVDQECLEIFDENTAIVEAKTLYKKWSNVDDGGFEISADGRVLYSFTGTQSEVVIPSTVKIIAAGAFQDLQHVESITLPAGISDIKENAFPGAEKISRTIYIYASSDGANNSKLEGQTLANRYEMFEYKVTEGETGSSQSPELSKDNIFCSLSAINLGIDDNTEFSYPQILLPTDLASGSYKMIFTELNTPVTIKTLLENAGYDMDSRYVYYMDISMKKIGEADDYKPTWSTGTMSISLPLPLSWYGRDSEKIHMFTVNTAGTALEEVSISNISSNIFTCHPKHFSEFALVFTGKITDSSSSGSTGDSSSGGSSSGGGDSSGDSSSSGGGDSSGGSSSSGGDSSGGSSSGGSSSSGGGVSSSSGGSSSGGGSTTGNTSGSTPTTGTTPIVTPPGIVPGVTPNIPLITVPTTPGTQPIVTTPTTTGNGSIGGTPAHVKDTTPKTGDPLEYRSILVCGFFSIGVLLLLIGNKKKTSSSVPYLRM